MEAVMGNPRRMAMEFTSRAASIARVEDAMMAGEYFLNLEVKNPF